MEPTPEEGVRDVADERKEWHEQRATILGATDSPKILGFSRWGTALSVYNEKVNPDTSDRQMSLPAWLGLKMQSTVGELYTTATGLQLRADNKMHRMKEHPYIGCHLDFRAWGRPKLLVECKTRAYMAGWGEEGSTKVPVEIWVQVQHEMMVTGAEEAHVAVLFGHHTFRVYNIPRDEEFIDGLLQKLIEFRRDHWEPQVPPLPTGHPIDTEIVRSRAGVNDGTVKAILPEQAHIVEKYRLARQNAAQANRAEAEAKNRIIDLIGEADGITGAFGTITYKMTKDSVTVHWDQVAHSYGRALDLVRVAEVSELEMGGKVYSDVRTLDLDAIQSLYTEVKSGYRRINVNLVEDES